MESPLLINGVLVVALRLLPLLVTLGTLALYPGLALGISNGNGFSGFPQSFDTSARPTSARSRPSLSSGCSSR